MESIRYLTIITVVLMVIQMSQVRCLDFGFTDFGSSSGSSSIKLMNDASISAGAVSLTQTTYISQASVGRMFYNAPIPLWTVVNDIKYMSPFTTSFQFRIKNLTSVSGDGLAFLLSGTFSPAPPNSNTDGLGLVNPALDRQASNQIIAVEFDTYEDAKYSDPSDNHVGINVNSLHSEITYDLTSRNIDLKRGNLLKAWVEYGGSHISEAKINVYISNDPNSEKPSEGPILTYPIDLSQYLPKDIYVGFSAASFMYAEIHEVHAWSFFISDLRSATTSPTTPDDSHTSQSSTNTNTNTNTLNATVIVNNNITVMTGGNRAPPLPIVSLLNFVFLTILLTTVVI